MSPFNGGAAPSTILRMVPLPVRGGFSGPVERRFIPPYIAPAMAAPVLAYENLGLVQGHGWLFRGLDLFIGERDRLALIGRNGAGKTTLLKCLAGLIETDEGRRTIQPGIKVVLLEQDPQVTGFRHAARFRAGRAGRAAVHEVEAIADQIGLDLDRAGGDRLGRRAAAGGDRAGAGAGPDVLLLDEPTNHLDLAGIEWLEDWLARYKGAFIAISHDRTFLTRLTRSSLVARPRQPQARRGRLWRLRGLDRAGLCRGSAQRRPARRQAEARAHWLQRGVTARRRRNQGRLAKLSRDARGAGGDAGAGGDGAGSA